MSTASELLSEAEALYQAGQLADAEQRCRQALASDPNNVQVHYLLGVVCHGQGKIEDAIASLAQTVQLVPGHIPAQQHLGMLLVTQGRLNEAVAHFENARRQNPISKELWDGLQTALAVKEFNQGMAHVAEQSYGEAADCFRRAVEHKPGYLQAQGNLGVALQLQGKLDEAAAAFRRAVELAPRDAESHRRLAGALEELGQRSEAIASCRRAVELQPDHAESQNSLGVLLERENRLDEARACLQRAVSLKPDFPDALSNLGAVLDRQGSCQEAVASLKRALELAPRFLEAHINLGSALEGLGQYDEARLALRRAIKLDPDNADAYTNLALVLVRLGRLHEARDAAECAVALDPKSANAQVNLGLILDAQGSIDAAADCYRRAQELDPNCAEAHLNCGMLLLRAGRLAEGWPEYDWRFLCERRHQRRRGGAHWAGEPIEGRTILLDDEQGFGDSMLFVRFAEVVKQRGARVIVECRPPLERLYKNCPGIDEVVTVQTPDADFDLHLPLASVPGVVGTTLENIPAEVPYLFPDAALVEKWKEELQAVDGFKVGIAWQGNPQNKTDRSRSIPLERFAPLADIAPVRLYSVQLGTGREQLADWQARLAITDLADRIDDFQDTAAIMRNLDLVITCDSAPAHLAGALGLPVWVALAFLADWRWFVERTDSPWYPTMRLYRQARPGDWQEVFERIAADLAAKVRTEQ